MHGKPESDLLKTGVHLLHNIPQKHNKEDCSKHGGSLQNLTH